MDQETLVRAACAEIIEHARNRRACLVFASGIKHGEHIVETVTQKHGVECGFVTGETPTADRDALLERFRSGRLMKKDALMKAVWPDTVVEEGNLTKGIFLLRQALGDTGDHRVFIETVPRVGYRFVMPAAPVDEHR